MGKFCLNNFVRNPEPSDRFIHIYDCTGLLVLSIDPYTSTFFNKSKYVYIVTDGKIDYNNVIQFNNPDEAEKAIIRLNDVKKLFIDRINNFIVDSANLVKKYEFNEHTANTYIHLSNNMYDALTAATTPSSTNPFATIRDIVIASGDTKEVKVSRTDTTPGTLIEKISGSDYVNIEILNQQSSEILQINVEGLTPLEIFNNFSATTNIALQSHVEDTSIHFTKSDIQLNDLLDVDTGTTQEGYYLRYTGGTWVGDKVVVDLSDYYTSSQTNNIFTTKSEFISHTSNTSLHITQNYRDAMDYSNNPSASNPFATLDDITIAASGLTIPVADNRYLKLTGGTIIDSLNINNNLTVNNITKIKNLEINDILINRISNDSGLTQSNQQSLVTENAVKEYVDSRGWYCVESSRYGVIYAPVDLLRGDVATNDAPIVAPYKCKISEIVISSKNQATWTGYTEVYDPDNLNTPIWRYPVYVNNESTKIVKFDNSFTIQKGYIIRMRIGDLIGHIKYPVMTIFLVKK